MMNVAFIRLLVAFTLLATASNEKSGLFANAEEVKYEAVGCFKDTTQNPRPLPYLVINFRWPAPQLNWTDLNSTIRACAEKVKEAGFVYFGVQFYGECWSGPLAHLTFDEDGESTRCALGVGMARANSVYRLNIEECSEYKVLSTADRSVGHDYSSTAGCDHSLPPAWYRFQGKAGNAMANECPSTFKCGTIVPGWLKGELPNVQDGIVSRTVCFHQSRNCCKRSVKVEVRNCAGFYVYKLPSAPYCQIRYCGNGKQE